MIKARFLGITLCLTILGGIAHGQIAVRQAGGTVQQPVANYRQQHVNPWSGSLRYLGMDQIQQEIELVEDQVEKITQIRKDVTTEMKNSYKSFQDLPAQDRTKRYQELNKELYEKTEQRIKDVLLPQQLKRLEQISLQMSLRSYGGFGYVLGGKDLSEKLKITDEQKKKLTELQKEMQQDLAKQMRELQEKSREETKRRSKEILDAQQRKQLDEMIGDKFEYEYPQYRKQVQTPKK